MGLRTDKSNGTLPVALAEVPGVTLLRIFSDLQRRFPALNIKAQKYTNPVLTVYNYSHKIFAVNHWFSFKSFQFDAVSQNSCVGCRVCQYSKVNLNPFASVGILSDSELGGGILGDTCGSDVAAGRKGGGCCMLPPAGHPIRRKRKARGREAAGQIKKG
jgi:hypothetical protein